MPSARARTAMRRDTLSRPARLALLHEIVGEGDDYFDYGCGRGDDVDRLCKLGIDASGWDPQHRPNAAKEKASVVNLGYVVNVIEDPLERELVLREAWSLARRVLVVAARLVDERDDAHAVACRDGWMTYRGTFQRFYEQHELASWIEEILGVDAVAAGPGVFYVFRSDVDRYEFLNSRFRRPVRRPQRRHCDRTYDAHSELLAPLIDFVATRGRLPRDGELENTEALIDAFGSLRQAFRVVLWVTDQDDWDRIRQERSTDLLVQLALARFAGRPRFGELPATTQYDVRAFFSSYTRACEAADRLLFATGNLGALAVAKRASLVGKAMPTALYIHDSALSDLPALLRVYEGCAAAFIGTIEKANVVKLSTHKAQVSYLEYADFDRDPHPALRLAAMIDLRNRKVTWRDYRNATNPPILHRKELLVAPAHPRRGTFARLSAQEERFGLYEDPASIGFRDGWDFELKRRHLKLHGHRVIRVKPPASGSPG